MCEQVKTESMKHTKCLQSDKSRTLPLLLLLLLLPELLQVFLGHLDDVAGLLLGSEEGGGEGAGPSVQRGARGGPRQTLPEILAHGLAFKKFSSERAGKVSHNEKKCFQSL